MENCVSLKSLNLSIIGLYNYNVVVIWLDVIKGLDVKEVSRRALNLGKVGKPGRAGPSFQVDRITENCATF